MEEVRCCIGLNISDLTGIEDFIALDYLDCNQNQLTSLDVSGATALFGLDCSDNQLTSLDVSQNTALTWLSCINNQLTSLDVSGATALFDLGCNHNQLTSLDVSGATALFGLDCSDNQLTSLDVSQNTALTWLQCINNQLTSLDVSGATALDDLDCSDNQLTSLDVSGATALDNLECYENQLTYLDVSNNTALTSLQCEINQLINLDVSNNTALTYLNCSHNSLISLDLSNNTALTYFDAEDNFLTCLNVQNGNNINFTLFDAHINTNLTCIEVDDSVYSTANWTIIDSQTSFSEDCNNACSGPPTADFIATSTNITEGASITFADNSTNSPASWNWQFSGGVPSISTNQNPVVTYNVVGTYDVVLLATNSTGSDTETKIGYITVSSTTTGIPEPPTIDKELLSITDILGRTTHPTPNTLLFYLYDDGSVEKRIQLDR